MRTEYHPFFKGFYSLYFTLFTQDNSANEICQEGKRSTINEKDMEKAMKEIGLEDLVPQLQGSLEGKIF